MKSEVVKAVFLDELNRTKRLIARYEKEIASFPKGSVFKRNINGNEYYYLNYRDGKKVISKFLGKADGFDIEELQEKLKKRAELKTLIKKLKTDEKELEKQLR